MNDPFAVSDSLEPTIPYLAFDIGTTADLLGVAVSVAEQLIETGQLKVIWAGGERRITTQTLQETRLKFSERKHRRREPLIGEDERAADREKSVRDLLKSKSALIAAISHIDEVLRERRTVT